MLKIIGITFVAIIALVVLFFLFTEGPRLLFQNFPEFSSDTTTTTDENENKGTNEKGVLTDQALLQYGLRTNTTQSSIPLSSIVTGGPKKDEIAAITDPNFIAANEALQYENGNQEGVVVAINGEYRLYPLNILVWHEIVNDSIAGSPILVTHSPLSGSSVVYNPLVQNERRLFGVSGLLWESNTLMYDTTNESLWSQITGDAVVGVDTDTKLKVVDSQLLTLATFSQLYPNGTVLSRPNNSTRDYNTYPYGDYRTNNTLLFETSIIDTQFPLKTLFYVVTYNNTSIAFKRDDLLTQEEVVLETNGEQLQASVQNGIITVTNSSGEQLQGYTTMWFAWPPHHQNNGVVWTG